jgi:hypothetical protein
MAKEDGDGDGDDPSTGVMIFEDFLWPHFWQNCDACHVSRWSQTFHGDGRR